MKIFGYLLILFIVVPILELIILFRVGGAVGALETYLIIIITGIIGAHLAKQQGVQTLAKIRTTIRDGKMPASEVVDGLIILIAAAVLITPGFITDIIGFLLLVPAIRSLVRTWLFLKFKTAIQSGNVKFSASGTLHAQVNVKQPSRTATSKERRVEADVIDVESRDIES